MASAFGHALAAVALGKILTAPKLPARFWLLGIVCAILPDADVLAFAFGIPYEHVLGHRGITHSILFAVVLALLVTKLFFRNASADSTEWRLLVSYFFLATLSHAVLDACTNGGLGVAFFAPFHNERYFFPVTPIQVSPIGAGRFFSKWGLMVLKSEAFWIGLPSLILLLIRYLGQKLR